jgi:hypothetical protein
MSASEVAPELHELVKQLTEASFRIDLRPSGGMDDGTTRRVYYGVRVMLDGLTQSELKQLLAIIDGAPYDGRISNGSLVLEPKRS